MTTKKKNNNTPAVVYQAGRWITNDGLSFNTQSKAEAHAAELINNNQIKTITDGKTE